MKKVGYAGILLFSLIPILSLLKYNADLDQFVNDNDDSQVFVKSNLKSQTTEIFVLGTVHFETENFKRVDLYKTLERIAPDIILYEAETKTLKKILGRKDYFFQFMDVVRNRNNTKVEKPVVLKYIDHNPSCTVLPYEWENSKTYKSKHDINSKATEMFQAILALYKEDKLTEKQSGIMDTYLKLIRELNTLGNSASLSSINSIETDSLVQQRQLFKYERQSEIVLERNDLAEFKEFSKKNYAYWDKRNKAMVQNIIKHANEHPQTRIVVLNGFYHRYFLIKELKKYQTDLNYIIKEIPS